MREWRTTEERERARSLGFIDFRPTQRLCRETHTLIPAITRRTPQNTITHAQKYHKFKLFETLSLSSSPSSSSEMASSLPAATAAATTATKAKNFSPSTTPQRHYLRQSPHAFLSSKLRLSAEDLRSARSQSFLVNAQSNEVGANGSSNTVATPATKSDGPASEKKDVKAAEGPSPEARGSETSISEFMNQVSSLVKLVDSRDIMELELKHYDFEVVIRKKEALLQPTSPAPVVMMPPSSAAPPPVPPAAAPTSPPILSPTPAAVSSPPAPKPAKSSLPPFKSPMAGTFYRSPGPGQPPFIKVGDKVQKGQPICIIEAMKLMNEIEADQSGKIVEILVEDAKSVSVDTPLFVIEP